MQEDTRDATIHHAHTARAADAATGTVRSSLEPCLSRGTPSGQAVRREPCGVKTATKSHMEVTRRGKDNPLVKAATPRLCELSTTTKAVENVSSRQLDGALLACPLDGQGSASHGCISTDMQQGLDVNCSEHSCTAAVDATKYSSRSELSSMDSDGRSEMKRAAHKKVPVYSTKNSGACGMEMNNETGSSLSVSSTQGPKLHRKDANRSNREDPSKAPHGVTRGTPSLCRTEMPRVCESPCIPPSSVSAQECHISNGATGLGPKGLRSDHGSGALASLQQVCARARKNWSALVIHTMK